MQVTNVIMSSEMGNSVAAIPVFPISQSVNPQLAATCCRWRCYIAGGSAWNAAKFF